MMLESGPTHHLFSMPGGLPHRASLHTIVTPLTTGREPLHLLPTEHSYHPEYKVPTKQNMHIIDSVEEPDKNCVDREATGMSRVETD